MSLLEAMDGKKKRRKRSSNSKIKACQSKEELIKFLQIGQSFSLKGVLKKSQKF